MKISTRMQEVITLFAKKHGLDLTLSGTHLRLEMPHFDALVVEVLHEHLVSVAHVYEPRPDVRIADPGIVFFTGYSTWVPIEVNQRIGGYRIYATLSEDLEHIESILAERQANLTSFAEMWAQNILDQDWLESGVAV